MPDDDKPQAEPDTKPVTSFNLNSVGYWTGRDYPYGPHSKPTVKIAGSGTGATCVAVPGLL